MTSLRRRKDVLKSSLATLKESLYKLSDKMEGKKGFKVKENQKVSLESLDVENEGKWTDQIHLAKTTPF